MKLSTRLSLIVLTVGFAITFINLLFIRSEIEQQQQSSQKLFAETLVQTMANAVVQDVINNEKVKLTRLLEIAQGYDENPIEYLYVTDMEGHLFAHSYKEGFPTFLAEKVSSHDAVETSSNPIRLVAQYNIKGRGLIYEYDISLISGLAAQLHIGLNQTEIQHAVSKASRQVVAAGLSISLFLTWLAWLATSYSIRPVTDLAKQLSQYTSGQQLDLHHAKYNSPETLVLIQVIADIFKSRDLFEKALIDREENLKVTLNSIGDAVIATDEQGNITQMNPVAEQLTGWTINEAMGHPIKTVFPIINASTRASIANPVDKVIDSGETVYLSNHTTLISKDGTEYQIADSAAPIRDVDNKILGMILVFNDVTEKYKLRRAAEQAQAQIQKLLNDLQTMVVVLDIDSRVTYANESYLKVRGLNASDVTGLKLWECDWFKHDNALQAAVKANCLQVISKNLMLVRDLQISIANGLLWVEVAFHPVLDDDGNVYQLVVEGRDISQRKVMEDDIRSSMQHLNLYREQTPLAAIEWNVDFQVMNWNQAAMEMFGYTLDEVKGRYFVDLMLPEGVKADVKQIWQDLIAQTGGTVSVNENLTKEGRIILCEWHNTPLINDAGEVIGAASLVLDVTKERAALLALEAKEQEQREILNTLSDGVITINGAGVILSYNQAAAYLFGFSAAETIGQNISLLMPEPDKSQHNGYLESYIASGRRKPLTESREVLGQHKNKSTFPMRLTVAQLPSSEDEDIRFIGTCQDLTQIKSQQAQLQRAQKMDALGKLVGGIAHDFNNMLGVIMGYTSLMEMKFSNVEGLQKYIDNIDQASERGRQLTKRMLSFSKQGSTTAQPVALHSVLNGQKELFSKSLTALIELNYQLCESPWSIWADPSELEDSLLNLVINAQYAMPEGGSLTFTTQAVHLSSSEATLLGLSENDYMKLSITDTGCGIDDDVINNIFDPFFSTKGTDGTGLGLSQVYGFMERVGGIIRVYTQKGVGSEFVLYFPRYKGEEVSDEDKAMLTSYEQGKGETILVVDDEPALRELAKEILTLAGYQVLTANDGDNALEMLATNTIDLLLSDVIMPNMDGYQLALQVQKQYPKIKIQLASGFSDNRHLVITDKVLHESMLHKPYSSKELLNRVSTLLYGDSDV